MSSIKSIMNYRQHNLSKLSTLMTENFSKLLMALNLSSFTYCFSAGLKVLIKLHTRLICWVWVLMYMIKVNLVNIPQSEYIINVRGNRILMKLITVMLST